MERSLLLQSFSALALSSFSEPNYDAILRDRESHNKTMKPYRDLRKKRNKQAAQSRKRNRHK